MKMVIKESDWIGGLGLHVPCCLSLTHTSLVSQHSLERRQDSSLSAHCLKIEQKCDRTGLFHFNMLMTKD